MSGMREKASGCSSLSGTISATTVRMMPTLPLDRPATPRDTSAHVTDCEKPKRMLLTIKQARPSRIAGFLPYASEARPQSRPVRLWPSEKTALTRPAWNATSSVLTLRYSIISGR